MAARTSRRSAKSRRPKSALRSKSVSRRAKLVSRSKSAGRPKARGHAGAKPARRPSAAAGASRRPATRPAPLATSPNAIGFVGQHLDFTSHDLAGVQRFYTELLGFSNFVHDPKFDYLSVTLARGVSIGFMPPMPGPPEQWRPPREPALYLVVEDADRAYAALTAKGVTFDQPPADMPWGDRAALLRDPEGRMVWIAHRPRKG